MHELEPKPKSKLDRSKTGRKKGTPNKRSVEFLETLRELNFDPAKALVHCYKEAEQIFEYRKQRGNLAGALVALDQMNDSAETLAQYAYPKKKAVEHTGEVGVRTFADFIASADKVDDEE